MTTVTHYFFGCYGNLNKENPPFEKISDYLNKESSQFESGSLILAGDNYYAHKFNLSEVNRNMKIKGVSSYDIEKIMVAYEPIWSIGTGKIPKINELVKIFIFIKKEIKKILKTKKRAIVLYGGSVSDKNVSMFSSIKDIDGFLIGGASRSSKKFIDIIKNYYK